MMPILTALLSFVLFIVAGTGAWVFFYRKSLARGSSNAMSHVRGAVYCVLSLGVLFVVWAIVIGGISSGKTSSVRAPVVAASSVPSQDVPNAADTPRSAAEPDVDMRLARIYKERRLEALERRLSQGDTDALSVIPALGGKSNVAKVLKAKGIRIGLNPYVSCESVIKLTNAPGCIVTVYLTRKPRQDQTDLSGVIARWYLGLNDKHFRPIDGWAERVDENSSWLNADSMLGEADNR